MESYNQSKVSLQLNPDEFIIAAGANAQQQYGGLEIFNGLYLLSSIG